MRVLFVSSGRKGFINPIIKNQGDALHRAGVDLEYYMLKGRGWKSYISNIKPLRAQIKSGKYDVIHVHYAFSAYMVSMATRGLKVPIVVSLMGTDIWAHKFYPLLARTVAKLKPWKAVIVKSKEMKERVGMPYAHVVPNGVNMDKFHPMDKVECQKKLGWINITHHTSDIKHVLFPADPAVGRKNWPLADAAVKRIVESGMCNAVLHPFMNTPNDETPLWYNAADAVVLPSFYEGSANAVKETMACNTPIVTTDMGDCRERIEGVEGCYVAKTYEVEEFAELLGKALAFGGKTKGRERLEADSIADNQVSERLMYIYEQAMKP